MESDPVPPPVPPAPEPVGIELTLYWVQFLFGILAAPLLLGLLWVAMIVVDRTLGWRAVLLSYGFLSVCIWRLPDPPKLFGLTRGFFFGSAAIFAVFACFHFFGGK